MNAQSFQIQVPVVATVTETLESTGKISFLVIPHDLDSEPLGRS